MKPFIFKILAPAFLIGLLAGGTLAPRPALAIGGNEEEPTASDATRQQYETAKSAIDAGRYSVAIPILQNIVKVEPKNANAWNLLAFSNRKLKKYDAALGFYRTALALDPEHLGAHEYLGELYLATGDLKSALTLRDRLQDLCRGGCEELDDLDKAITAFRKSGGKAESGS